MAAKVEISTNSTWFCIRLILNDITALFVKIPVLHSSRLHGSQADLKWVWAGNAFGLSLLRGRCGIGRLNRGRGQ